VATRRRIDYLQTFRIVQDDLLYVIGLPIALADESLLVTPRFFGTFGTVKKLLINKATGSRDSAYEGQCAVYVWYHHAVHVALAVKVSILLTMGSVSTGTLSVSAASSSAASARASTARTSSLTPAVSSTRPVLAPSSTTLSGRGTRSSRMTQSSRSISALRTASPTYS